MPGRSGDQDGERAFAVANEEEGNGAYVGQALYTLYTMLVSTHSTSLRNVCLFMFRGGSKCVVEAQ